MTNPILFASATDVGGTVNQVSLVVAVVGSILLAVLLLVAVVLKRHARFKAPLFAAIVTVVVGTTLTIGGNTVYLNVISATGGPVHWHADFELWACGNQLNLRDPTGLSNKIGTPDLHEHNDGRIHLEGVPVTLPSDFSLGKFMNVVGGGLSSGSLTVPLNDTNYFEPGTTPQAPELIDPFVHTEASGKVATFVSGQQCGTQTAQVQVFAYHFNAADNTYRQTKLSDPADYSPAHEENVPPGDCIIMEFGPATARTNKLCKQYGLRDQSRCGDFGVPADQRKATCTIREVQ